LLVKDMAGITSSSVQGMTRA